MDQQQTGPFVYTYGDIADHLLRGSTLVDEGTFADFSYWRRGDREQWKVCACAMGMIEESLRPGTAEALRVRWERELVEDGYPNSGGSVKQLRAMDLKKEEFPEGMVALLYAVPPMHPDLVEQDYSGDYTVRVTIEILFDEIRDTPFGIAQWLRGLDNLPAEAWPQYHTHPTVQDKLQNREEWR